MNPAELPNIPNPGAPAEPLLTVGSMVALATAVVAFLVAFGFNLSLTQQAAILGIVSVAAPLVVAFLGRTRVYAPQTVRRMVRRAEGKDPVL